MRTPHDGSILYSEVDEVSDESPKWLRVIDFAREYRVNPATVYRGIRDGTIPAIRVGRLLRIPTGVHHVAADRSGATDADAR